MARAADLTGATMPLGSKFGRYTIVRPIGAGGMGAVYEATQESPRRSVALKVIRGTWLSAQLLRRFEHESQVLGRLQHPGIAQVYEAGSAKDPHGETVPFFAMELIKGVPLTEYAAAKNLGTRERLELVARICDAVYHAHQKGVIHRDLKPGNILVDESGQPKILDFGVARATDSDIQQTTMQTDIGQLIGTVPYMSPEQVSGDPNELDTRSDVYALGVISYELLAGRLPYDLQKKMIHEAVRVIREEDPTRLSSINRTLRGDIETIVAKALEKDKQRRYQSAEALGSDIRRYLKDEPIAARPASTWYQAAKFARRNKVLVGGVAATFAVLLAGIIGVSLMLQRALEAESDLTEQIGETNAALKKTQEAEKAERTRAGELQQVSEFQEKMLGQVDPTTAGVWLTEDVTKKLAAALEKEGVPEQERAAQVDAFRQQWVKVNATDAARELIDRTILRPAVKVIDEQFKDQPLVDAQLRQVLANVYYLIGLPEEAAPLQSHACMIRGRLLGEQHPLTLVSHNNMGLLLQNQGRLTEAERYYRSVLDMRRHVLGDDHPHTIATMSNLSSLFADQGKLGEAESLCREALERARRAIGEEHFDTLSSINNLASILQHQQRYDEAEPLFREVVEKFIAMFGEESPSALTALNNLCVLLQLKGDLAEAVQLGRRALEGSRRVLGEEHPDTIGSINTLGYLHLAQGNYVEAELYILEALRKSRSVLGEDHETSRATLNNYCAALWGQGKLAEAVSVCREVTERRRRLLGGGHPETLQSVVSLYRLLVHQGSITEAEPFGRESLEMSRLVWGEDHPTTIELTRELGLLFVQQRNLVEAESQFAKVLEKRRRVLGEDHPDTLAAAEHLGDILHERGENQAAVDLLSAVEPITRRVFADGYAPRLAAFLTTLGRARAGLGYDSDRFALAEANLLEAHAIYLAAKDRGEKHKDTIECVQGLVDLYTAWHAAEPGKGYDAKAAEWKAKLPPVELPPVTPPVAPPSSPPG